MPLDIFIVESNDAMGKDFPKDSLREILEDHKCLRGSIMLRSVRDDMIVIFLELVTEPVTKYMNRCDQVK